MIGLMKKPDEQTIIEMRYFDEASWWTICAVLYGKEDDYETNSQRYLKRAFKIHGSALQTLAKIEKEKTPPKCPQSLILRAFQRMGIKGDKKGQKGIKGDNAVCYTVK